MEQIIQNYIKNIQEEFNTGKATEHTYRPALKALLEAINPKIKALNEGQRTVKVGAPDFRILQDDLELGWIEVKDLYVSLDDKANKDQLNRYLDASDNLIFTNNLEFRYFRNKQLVHGVSLGEIKNGKLIIHEANLLGNNIETLGNLLQEFLNYGGQYIKSSKGLAEIMAGKARLLKDIIVNVINDQEDVDAALQDQFNAFKNMLVHDLTAEQFSDMYAQTIVYGLFVARLHDNTLETFSREEAEKLIPKSNDFLRNLFRHIAFELDERISWIVDSLVEIFNHCDIKDLLKNHGKSTSRTDPIIHFYETFLTEYNPKLRKSRGVYYTPAPVVSFIVRGIDQILKDEFGLSQGLADTSKIEAEKIVQGKKVKQQVHRVQLLDPATGTGTFLDEVVKYIYEQFGKNNQGIWNSYVNEHLLPRIFGFELLMAPYTMAHLKLGLTLADTGYDDAQSKIGIYLTNSLEEAHDDTQSLFSSRLSAESQKASDVKNNSPIMIVTGNPPYSGESGNKSDWIMKLMEDYKKEPGGKQKLQEQNSKWINDDYVKFIRFAESFVEKKGEGIVAFINSHGFLDNPTFRGMRRHLLHTFDKIYIVDLHGNSKKKEVCPDGSKDENVFDIQAGVSIQFFVKTNQKKKGELAKLYHKDLYGVREDKYKRLEENILGKIDFSEVKYTSPNYFFVPKDFDLQKKYDKGISVRDLFPINGTGIVTKRDNLCINDSKDSCYIGAYDILNLPKDEFYKKYKLPEDVRDWRYEWAVKDISDSKLNKDLIKPINYRPFDKRYMYYTGHSRGFVGWPVEKIMKNFLKGDNLGLATARQCADDWRYVFVTKEIGEFNLTGTAGRYGSGSFFPLYLYQTDISGNEVRTPNFNIELVNKIEEGFEMKMILGNFESNRETIRIFCDSNIKNLPEVFDEAQKNNIQLSYFPIDSRFNEKNPEGDIFTLNTKGTAYFSAKGPKSFLNLEPVVIGSCFDDIHLAEGENPFLNKGEVCYMKGMPTKYTGGENLLKQYKVEFENILGAEIKKQEYFRDFLILINSIFQKHIQSKVFSQNKTQIFNSLHFTDKLFSKILISDDFKGILTIENRKKIKSTFGFSILSGLEGLKKIKEIRNEFFTPEDIFDYIYAVLHSPTYRETYKEFLKIDFPRIPFTKDKFIFNQMVNYGKELRKLHLLESDKLSQQLVSYPMSGDNKVEKVKFDGEKVWINDTQYFDHVPEIAWNFYIGGYQPAQKRLKDRKERTLSFDDIVHYQRMIIALVETDKLMKEIDGVKIV